ncbi:MAG: DNA-deoxyinosine glycosylase [Spirochaetia bacterium]|nr:DNA-deoxyinosine glycosylase [Spirochaetia bacterium]
MKRGFPPIEGEHSHTLILGTGPSVRSLLKQQYYGHERNAFWPIMQTLFDKKSETYEEKWLLLQDNNIALWDVLASFERKGSLDSAYKEIVPNDLELFIKAHSALRKVLFNGKKAESFYKRLIGFYPDEITFHSLPSTSAAYTLSVAEKTRAWGEALLL